MLEVRSTDGKTIYPMECKEDALKTLGYLCAIIKEERGDAFFEECDLLLDAYLEMDLVGS